LEKVGWANGSGFFMVQHNEKGENKSENSSISDNHFLHSTQTANSILEYQ
jgi:hypothetical protein